MDPNQFWASFVDELLNLLLMRISGEYIRIYLKVFGANERRLLIYIFQHRMSLRKKSISCWNLGCEQHSRFCFLISVRPSRDYHFLFVPIGFMHAPYLVHITHPTSTSAMLQGTTLRCTACTSKVFRRGRSYVKYFSLIIP